MDGSYGAAPRQRARTSVSKRAKFLKPKAVSETNEGTKQCAPQEKKGPTIGRGSSAAEAPPPETDAMRSPQEAVLSNGDILKMLFGLLRVEDLCNAAGVNRQWQTVSQLPELWTSISLTHMDFCRAKIQFVLSRHPSVESLSLSASPTMDEDFLEGCQSVIRNIRFLELGAGIVPEQILKGIGMYMPLLTRLQITDASLGKARMQGEVVIAHDCLRELEATGCRVTRLTVRCARLQSLLLRNSFMTFLVPSCPELLHLDLTGCGKLSDSSLRSSLRRLPKLNSLHLAGNLLLTSETLREAITSLTNLEHLGLSGCIAVSLSVIPSFPMLRFLDLSCCDGLFAMSAMTALQSLTTLEQLVMDNCSLIEQVSLSLPHLSRLYLRGCRSLQHIFLDCPALEELQIGRRTPRGRGCASLTTIYVASDRMESGCWRGFPALRFVKLSCPLLKSLDLSECDALEDVVFDGLSNQQQRESGQALAQWEETLAQLSPLGCVKDNGCPRLESLRADYCEGLSDVVLTSASLETLSLTGCKGLRSVKLGCPSLTDLRLDECDRAESAVLAPVAVRAISLGTCPSLRALRLSGPRLARLDLKGCGLLSSLELDCPSLTSLDATFCSSLSDGALHGALCKSPPLVELLLSACTSLGRGGLPLAGPLRALRRLDLSYTEVETVEPVVALCPALQSLSLASCSCLREGALDSLVPAASGAATGRVAMTALDASYCPLSSREVSRVLLTGRALESLAISGCANVTDEVWDGLNSDTWQEPHALRSVSCVGCKAMRSCVLGLREPAGDASRWEPCSTALSRLESLRLGLSGISTLALALPALATLDVNGCCSLKNLELRCPVLLSGCFQACRQIGCLQLSRALGNCSQLEVLDVQHMDVDREDVKQLRAQGPSLRCLLHTTSQTN